MHIVNVTFGETIDIYVYDREAATIIRGASTSTDNPDAGQVIAGIIAKSRYETPVRT